MEADSEGQLAGREVLERVSEGILALDGDLVCADANAHALGLVERERADVVGRHVEEILPSTPETGPGDVVDRAVDTQETVTHEFRDGERDRWYSIRVYPDGNGATVFFDDITEQRRREEDLERAETLFENAQDAFFLMNVDTDGEYTIERVNPAYERLTGLSRADIRGKSIGDVFSEADAATIRARYDKCVASQETVEYVDVLSVPEPNSYWETRIAPVIVDGAVTQIAGAARDITDRKTYEQQLEEQRDRLELLNQMVRHDIRNDLQVISSYAELLKEQVGDDVREYVDRILTNTRTAVELTRTARDISGTMLQSDTSTEPVPLRSVLSSQIDELRTTYTDAVVTVDGQIPGVSVIADDMLSSVFRNVIKNAVQHNDKEVPEVQISVTESGGRVRISVADNGPGIPDGQKSEIFGRGEKGLESEGTGIGLYLVNTLVERYGGTVQVHDNEPDGTIVTVTLTTA